MASQAISEQDLDLVEPPFEPSLVAELLRAFAKAARAHQLYLPNNPMHARALDNAKSAFAAVWKETDSLTFQITESDLRWIGRPFLEEPDRTSDSIPWQFYKDGVRELVFRTGFEESELLVLLTLMQRARLASAEDDDLLTLLWEHDFSYLQYKYVELGSLAGPAVESLRGEIPERIVAPNEVESEAQVLASSTVARMDEYDSTLYFLDDHEIQYLRDEVRKDFGNDMRMQVVASLLDTFEQEVDPTVREEVAGILDNLFVLFLSLTQFRTAAYLIREAIIAANRATDILVGQRQRLLELSDRLSEKEVLEQLLEALEETPLRPPQNDLHELFGQLKPNALETVLSWLGRSRNNELRVLLESAASKLASTHTSELVRLISSEDEVVVFEAIRRAGAMKASVAVSALAGIIEHGTPEMRLAGVAALSDIGSPGALQVLERALADEDRDIRIATVKVLGSRNHDAALRAIEAHIKTKTFREGTLAEKMAFFETYGMLCGDKGVPMLSEILNTRKILGGREDGELRACAAMALGKIGTDEAMRALQKALADRDVIVRNAVSRAVRG
ncbi:MAG TPA: HEAT repeat domain-containing protein [Gemmatimonadaceae bacterium]